MFQHPEVDDLVQCQSISKGEVLVMQQSYELMTIIDSSLESAMLENTIKRVDDILHSSGATVTLKDNFGKRTLAYSIDHRNEGVYVIFDFIVDKSKVAQMESALSLVDGIVRHRIIKIPENRASRPPTLLSSSGGSTHVNSMHTTGGMHGGMHVTRSDLNV